MSKMSTQVKIGPSNFGRHFPKRADPEFDRPQNLVKYLAKYTLYAKKYTYVPLQNIQTQQLPKLILFSELLPWYPLFCG